MSPSQAKLEGLYIVTSHYKMSQDIGYSLAGGVYSLQDKTLDDQMISPAVFYISIDDEAGSKMLDRLKGKGGFQGIVWVRLVKWPML